MAGLKEIAEITGLSINTVSRALRYSGYVSAESRAKVMAAAEQIHYHPNRAARDLRRNSSSIIAVVAESGDALHIEKITAIQEEAAVNNYSVNNFFTAPFPGSTLDDVLRTLHCEHPAGIIFIGLERTIVEAARKMQEHFPVAVISYSAEKDINCVYMDRYHGVAAAVRHMYSQGCRRIAYMGTDKQGNKFKGYCDTINQLGLQPVVFPCNDQARKEEARTDAAVVAASIKDMILPPDGIQCSDYHAVSLIAELQALGIRVPEDIAVSGFDDRDFTVLVNPALTTVAQPNREAGREAIRLLLEAIKTPSATTKTVLVPMTLKIRESTL